MTMCMLENIIVRDLIYLLECMANITVHSFSLHYYFFQNICSRYKEITLKNVLHCVPSGGEYFGAQKLN